MQLRNRTINHIGALTLVLATSVGAYAKQPGVRISRIDPDRKEIVRHTRCVRGAGKFMSPFAAKRSHVKGQTLSVPRQPVAAEAPGRRPVYGLVTFASSWTDYENAGIYRIPTGGGAEFVPVATSAEMQGENAVMAGDQFWLTHLTENMFGQFQWGALYDPATWTRTADNLVNTEFDAQSLAYDGTTQTVYGSFRQSGGTFNLATLNITTNKLADVASLGQEGFTSMAFDGEGQLYATTVGGTFGKVDKTSGALTAITMGVPVSQYNTSAAIDPSARCYYYAFITDSEAAMYAIDLDSGAQTKLYDMPDGQNIIGMWVGEDEASAKAPASAENLSAVFAAGALSGTVEFDMPSTLYDGSALTGSVTYTVRLNGADKAEAQAEAGAHVAVPVTVETVGSYTIEVVVTNSAGASPAAAIVRWIGSDTLLPLNEPVLERDGEAMHLEWQAPQAANGGFIDAASITYDVVRYPGAVAVANGISATCFDETVPAPEGLERCHYTVTVNYNGTSFAAVASNRIVIGSAELPYAQRFDTESAGEYFTVLDANNDGYTWQWSSGAMRVRYNIVDMDDWLILPPMNLKKGEYYEISFKVWAESTKYPEKIAVYAGTSSAVSAMTSELMAPSPVTVDGDNKMTVKRYFSPQADGVYYFGIHGCSAANNYYLNVDDVTVAAGLSATAPAGVKSLTVTPADYGKLEAELSFILPDTDVAGGRLNSISKVDVLRNGVKIGNVDNPVPGASRTFRDNDAPHGEVTYTLVAYLDGKEGERVSASCFVGISSPLPVTGVKLTRGSDTGEVVVSWDPVTEDVNGMHLSAGQVTYDVYRIVDEHSLVVASETAGTSVTDRVVAAGAPEEFTFYAVKAFTAYGSAEDTESDLIPVGKPSEVPYRESVAGSHLSNLWTIDLPADGGAYWETADDAYIEGITSVDGDGGFFDLVCDYRGYEGTLISGNIAIPSDLVSPGLTFYYFNYDSTNYIEVLVNDGTGFVKVDQVTLSPDSREGWTRKVVAMDRYLGKTVQIAFRGVIVNTNIIAIDDLRLGTMPANDLVARGITVPEIVKPNESYRVTVAVENAGLSAASAYKVVLYENDAAVAETEGPAIAASAMAEVAFDRVMDMFAAPVIEYYATVEFTSDNDNTNNTAEPVVTYVKFPAYPAVNDLSGSVTGDGAVALSWSAPDLDSGVPAAVTDDVEAYEPFSTGLPGSEVEYDDMGDWLVIDGDGGETFVIQGSMYPNSGKPMAFMVLNTDWAGLTGAHSGSQMFACFGAVDADYEAITCDDWLISPQLYGGAQTISLYARSMNAQYKERMQLYYSTGGTEKADFIEVKTVEQVEGDWTRYMFDVPDGAERFAIRCTSHDQFALLVDDITYIPRDPELADLSIAGYNVYRDGVKLNDTPVTDTAFEDQDADASKAHTYHVTTVYTSGESKLSNACKIDLSGLSAVEVADVTISAVRGAVVVCGAEGLDVTVASIDGRVVFSGKGTRSMTVHVAPGYYVVKAGSTVGKLSVR